MSDSDNKRANPQAIEDALRAIGRRPRPSSEGTLRAYARAHEAWQQLTRQRARRRRTLRIAIALAASLLIALTGGVLWPQLLPSESVAIVAFAQGRSNYEAGSSKQLTLSESDSVDAGGIVETSDGARLALQLATGHSLRLDRGTRIAILGGTEFRLERGRVYVDSGLSEDAPPLRIDTPSASVTDIGTQFQLSWIEDALRVHVREGSVSLRTPNANTTTNVLAGEAVLLTQARGLEKEKVASFGGEWSWVAEAAPGMDPEERRLDRILAWVCRELGYTLRFADARTAQSVERVVLDGSLEGLTPQQTLDVLQNITKYRYRQEAGELTLESLDDYL
jgi:ferric-dicitrate binding protein FerR (iron transport regulator)